MDGFGSEHWLLYYSNSANLPQAVDIEGKPTLAFLEACRRIGPAAIHRFGVMAPPQPWPREEWKKIIGIPSALGTFLANGINGNDGFIGTTEAFETRPRADKAPLRFNVAANAAEKERIVTLWWDLAQARSLRSSVDDEVPTLHWRGIARSRVRKIVKKIKECRSAENALSMLKVEARSCFLSTY